VIVVGAFMLMAGAIVGAVLGHLFPAPEEEVSS
jgi:hypothetical protein